MSWRSIECEPGVLTDIIRQLKVKGVRVEKLYSLDSQYLNDLLPVYGLIFLSKLRLPQNDDRPVLSLQHYSPYLFFAKREPNNGCATQAVISILMNWPAVDIGPELSHLKQCIGHFLPSFKGFFITKHEAIRNAHNSFAKEEPAVSTSEEPAVYTFINYVPFNNIIYELDGLKEGPICLGQFDGTAASLDWLNVVRPILQERVEKYMESNIDFSVLAVIKDRKDEYVARLECLHRRNEQVLKQSTGRIDIESLQQILAETNYELETVKQNDEKIRRWKRENEIRKHAPFLKILSDKGKLDDAIKKAKSGQKK